MDRTKVMAHRLTLVTWVRLCGIINHLSGDAIINSGPGLLLVVEKFPWANTLDVTHGIDASGIHGGPVFLVYRSTLPFFGRRTLSIWPSAISPAHYSYPVFS